MPKAIKQRLHTTCVILLARLWFEWKHH